MASINTIFSILDPAASPQTGVGDGDSGIVRVGPKREDRIGGPDSLYEVLFSADFAGGAATLTPQLCADPAESPRRWIAISKLQDDGTDAAITRAADFHLVLSFPAGVLIKWVVSGSGSPIPNIKMTARGIIRGSA